MSKNIETAFVDIETRLAMLRVLSDNSFDSILITDATVQGKILYANKAFKNLTGHDPSEVIGKTPRILQGVGTDKNVIDRLPSHSKMAKNFKTKQLTIKKMDRLLLCTGELRPSKSAKKLKLGLQSSGKALLSRNRCIIILLLAIRLQGSTCYWTDY